MISKKYEEYHEHGIISRNMDMRCPKLPRLKNNLGYIANVNQQAQLFSERATYWLSRRFLHSLKENDRTRAAPTIRLLALVFYER